MHVVAVVIALLFLAGSAFAKPFLVEVDYNGTIRELDENFRVIRENFIGGDDLDGNSPNSLAPAPGGYFAHVGGPEPRGLLKIDARTLSRQGTLSTPGALDVRSLATAPDGTVFAAGTSTSSATASENTLYAIDPSALTTTPIGLMNARAMQAMAFAPDGQLYGFGISDSAMRPGARFGRIDTATGEFEPISSDGYLMQSIVFAGGRLIAADQNQYFLIDRLTGNLLEAISPSRPDVDIRGIAISTVPVPAALPLLVSALGGLAWLARRRPSHRVGG